MVKQISDRKGTAGNVLKVIELGLKDRVYDAMKKPGFSAEALARQFHSENIKITAQSIRKFIKKTNRAQQEIIRKDLRASQELVKLTMDYNKALKDILDEVDEVKNTVKGEKDYHTYNLLIGRLLQGIELFAKLTGDIKPKGTTDIKIIYNEINMDIEKKMKEISSVFDAEKTIIDVEAEIIEEDKKMSQKLKDGEI